MRLTDIMSGANLAVYPEIGLLIFLAVFVAIAVRVYRRSRGEEHARWAAMPLDEGMGGTGVAQSGEARGTITRGTMARGAEGGSR